MIRLTQLTFRRAREERLAQLAASLTFSTVLAAVPVLAVSFALFVRFPVFRGLQQAIERVLLPALLPADIARTVLKYLGQFAANASGLTWIGSACVLATAVALLLTVENALNRIWGVRRGRPWLQRLGGYLAVLVLAPLLIGASLWATSAALAASAGLIGPWPPALRIALDWSPVIVGAIVLAAVFRVVPHARVRRRHAIVGGVAASVALELGKRGFTAYLLKLPTYKTVYGAFAALPAFLLWVYFSWLVLLGAAVLVASLGAARGRAR